jgi:RNA polymerase sigma-70 factor, ECF subfamily
MPAVTSTFGLLDRVHKGDREAFALLFDQYSRRLAVLIHYRLSAELRASLEIDDVLQEVFFRAFRDIGKFEYRSPGSFMNWLSKIAGHVIIDLARFHGREQRQAVETVPFRSESNPRGPQPVDSMTPSRILRENEEVDTLIGKLSALPGDYREAILLAKVEGLSTAEVAERMGKSREAAALLVHRAVKRFRSMAAP